MQWLETYYVDTEIKVEYSDMPNNRGAQINVDILTFFISFAMGYFDIKGGYVYS